MASTEIQGADASPVSIPVVPVKSGDDPLSGDVLASIAGLLPEFLASRRWFRAKARTIENVAIEDVVPFSATNSLFVLSVSFTDGGSDRYLLPLSRASADDSVRNSPASEPLVLLRTEQREEQLLYSAFANPSFRSSILAAIRENKRFEGANGSFLAQRLSAADAARDEIDPAIDSAVSRAEQSNTSVIYGDRFILKLFRKIEEGVNPDLEIGAFLTQNGFANTPAVVGTLEYRGNERHETYAAGILQSFVQNRGDAWKYTLDALSGYFSRALVSREIPQGAPAEHPLWLMERTVPVDVQSWIGSYLDSARLLGRRTAEMHAVLAGGLDPDFAPEPVSLGDTVKLHAEMHEQADVAFGVLRLKKHSLSGEAAAEAQQLLSREPEVRQRFAALRDAGISAQRIRFHGDYHLGQVLYTGTDFMIIDFEGEPARPLHERRTKTLALRDVAGMVRSFQYAAYAALFNQVAGVTAAGAERDLVEQWSELWYAWVSATFLRGYFDAASTALFVPRSADERRLLLDAFLLHKALYEVAYELNNRPAWVRIPLRGILSLIA